MHTAITRVISRRISCCEEQRGEHTQNMSENTRKPGKSKQQVSERSRRLNPRAVKTLDTTAADLGPQQDS